MGSVVATATQAQSRVSAPELVAVLFLVCRLLLDRRLDGAEATRRPMNCCIVSELRRPAVEERLASGRSPA